MKLVFRNLFLTAMAGSALVAQSVASGQKPPAETAATASDSKPECVEPGPLFSADDYDGPFRKAVSYFSRKLEIKTVHSPRRTPRRKLCSLDSGEKFHLFLSNTFEPVTFVGAGFNAGLDQAEDNDPTFGQGMAGYGKRYAAALTDTASSDFFHTFLFPVLFRQDPRYYRRFEGRTSLRLGHALSHVFVAHSDSGKKMFNFSEWLGTASSTALANLYHPGKRRGFGPAASRTGISIGTDMGFDVLREFWPEIVRGLRLPFRVRDSQL
ncbi:MAG TPA: hypothetical protein VJA94_25635 [Candidatus Angelobacter sp.]